MKIALVTNEYVIDESGAGGLANYTYRMALAIKEAGHTPYVIYCPWIRSYKNNLKIIHNGISVYIANPVMHPSFRIFSLATRVLSFCDRMMKYYGLDHLADAKVFLSSLTCYLSYSYGARRKVQEINRLKSIDVCQYTHLYGLGALAPSCTRKVTRLSSHPDLWSPYGLQTSRAEKLAQSIALKRADLLTAPSSFVGLYVENMIRRRVAILPSPYLPLSKNESNSNMCGWSQYGLYFGSLAEWKGIQVLVTALQEVFSRQTSFKFVFVGRDLGMISGMKPSDYIREKLKNYHQHFKILPNQSQDNLSKVIQKSMFCCFPTLADNFPNVVLDAMSHSKCIIASRGRGVDEQIVDGLSGILIDPESPSSLSKAIFRVIKMTESQRAKYGCNAHVELQRFTPRACVDQLLSAYSTHLHI